MAKLHKGDTINLYVLDEDFRMKDGANCVWTFATKGGSRYFIKQFLSPRYPVDGAPGSAAEKERRRAECDAWERDQKQLLGAVKKVAGDGGALVVPVSLFRQDAYYYKVSPRVEVVAFSVEQISTMPVKDRLAIMGAVARAVFALHNAGVIHGDLAHGNVLISRRTAGDYAANVIDFDNSYLAGDPPTPERLMGNPPYYSPEVLDYIQGHVTDPNALTARSDVFALGLLFWQYMYGSLPTFTGDHQYACEAVRAGDLPIEPRVERADVHELLVNMLRADVEHRPSMMGVQNSIKTLSRDIPAPPFEPPVRPPVKVDPGPLVGADPTDPRRRLKGSGVDTAGASSVPIDRSSPRTSVPDIPYEGPSRVNFNPRKLKEPE